MRRSYIPLLVLLIMMAFPQGACRKEDEEPFLDIPMSVQQIVPYEHGQVLRFQDDTGHIYTCVVEKHDEKIDDKQGKVRTIWYYIRDTEYKLNIAELGLGADYLVAFTVMVTRQFFPGGRDGAGVRYPMDSTGVFKCDSPTICHPSYIINGRAEQDVTEIRQTPGLRVFYSKSKGLLRWEFGTSRAYTRID